MASGRIQVAVYYIDKSLFKGKSHEEIIDDIVNKYNIDIVGKKESSSEDGEKFSLQKTKAYSDLGNFQVKIYHSEKHRSPKWRRFLEPVLDRDANLLKKGNKDVSYIAFIYDEDHLYAISCGTPQFLDQ